MAENNYIDKIKKDGIEYEIHDPRVDEGGGSEFTLFVRLRNEEDLNKFKTALQEFINQPQNQFNITHIILCGVDYYAFFEVLNDESIGSSLFDICMDAWTTQTKAVSYNLYSIAHGTGSDPNTFAPYEIELAYDGGWYNSCNDTPERQISGTIDLINYELSL